MRSPRLSATAQAIYRTLAVGTATALLTVACGWLYARLGPQAFAVINLLPCGVAHQRRASRALSAADLNCCIAALYGNEH
jgi:hypothetical protein